MTIEEYANKLLALFPADVRGDLILGGGCLRAFYDDTPIKDIDVWFRSLDKYHETVARLIHAGWEQIVSPSGCTNFKTPDGAVVNLIGFHFGEAVEIVHRFDFRCCAIVAVQNYDFGAVVAHLPGAQEDAAAKLIYVLNNNGTGRTLRRIEYYMAHYGYSIHPDMGDQEGEDDGVVGHMPQGARLDKGPPPEESVYERIARILSSIPVTPFGY